MAHSERFWFEHWLANWATVDLAAIRQQRSKFGYENPLWDMAWAAWQKRAVTRV